jgi:flagellar motor switch protein FliG
MDDNLRKAALLIASIPEADSAALMSRLSAEQIEALSTATQAVSSITTEQQHQIVAELIELRYRRDDNQALHDTRRPDGCHHWHHASQIELEHLQHASTEWLAEQLSAELPQTAAVILTHLRPSLAARTLACLSTETQLEVVKRMASYEAIPSDLVHDVITALSSRLRLGRLAEINNRGGLALVAQIVQRLDRATERALLENLAQDNRTLVDQLLKLMFLLRDRQRVCQLFQPEVAADDDAMAA